MDEIRPTAEMGSQLVLYISQHSMFNVNSCEGEGPAHFNPPILHLPA